MGVGERDGSSYLFGASDNACDGNHRWIRADEQMSYKLELTIPILPRLPNQLLGSHWRTRASHADKWRSIIAREVALHGRPPEPLKRAKLTFIRRSTKRPDHDGLVGGFKAIQDSLVRAGVIVDDTFEVIGVPTYDHEKVGPKCGGVYIKIEELSEQQTKETK